MRLRGKWIVYEGGGTLNWYGMRIMSLGWVVELTALEIVEDALA